MDLREEDAGEGTSLAASTHTIPRDLGIILPSSDGPPPEYTSPSDDDESSTPRASEHSDTRPLLQIDPPIPSYEAAMGDAAGRHDARNDTEEDT